MTRLPNTFEIGLVCAGAVSGGAYTAGAMDFLIEALDAWYAAKRDDPGSVPGHDVLIRALAGASAGSMCSAIGAVALAGDFPPVRPDDLSGAERNPFYNSWVSAIDIADLLTTDDLQGASPTLKSILNSRKLSAIVDGVLSLGLPPRPRAYLAQEVSVRLTVGNLRGVPYEIRAKGSPNAAHGMMEHSDYMGFIAQYPSGRETPYRPTEEYRLPAMASAGDPNWAMLGQSALGSGAFPLFLEPRRLRHAPYPEVYARRKIAIVGERCRLDEEIQDRRPELQAAVDDCYRVRAETIEPVSRDGARDYEFVVVDGGVFDNEPLELARTALAGPLDHNPRSGDKAFRAVVMIDPFLETLECAPIPADEPIWKIGGRLLTAWKMDARFDPEELALANTPNNFSRFLLAPSRGEPRADADGRPPPNPAHPLAAGGLSGFLGFFDRSYRHHGYMLGRRNMQRFLQRHFVLPEGNDLFAGVWTDAQRTYWGWVSEEGTRMLPIVPLVPRLHPEKSERAAEPLPRWPDVVLDVERIGRKIRVRLDRVFRITVRGSGLSWLMRALAIIGWWIFARGLISRKALAALRKALADQDLPSR